MARLGHVCVFASEIDPGLRRLYRSNFGVEPAGDIKGVGLAEIPGHDILCAGFPCQPFSKAGSQAGLKCLRNGDLFDKVVEILDFHRPSYFILENVPNLLRHNHKQTWKSMRAKIEAVGYRVGNRLISPHQFGIPQIRERAYIVGALGGLSGYEWPPAVLGVETTIHTALDDDPADARRLSDQATRCLDVWQEFLDRYPKDRELPSFPIWSMEFGADYPYDDVTPHAVGPEALGRYKGSHGRPLRELRPGERFSGLPSYARPGQDRFPGWKIDFIRRNRLLYAENRDWIDRWLPAVLEFPASLQKLEWNYKGGERNVWKHVIQFRASGVRIKRATSSPSLIAMTTTQVPIIGWQRRYMTPRECSRLQSLDDLPNLPAAAGPAFKALGNAINAKVVEKIARRLLGDHAGSASTGPIRRPAYGLHDGGTS